MAEVRAARMFAGVRRPVGRRVWITAALVAVVTATLISLAVRSSTSRPDRPVGPTNAIAGGPANASATELPIPTSTPTPEVSASQTASHLASPSADASRYGPVGYEAEAPSNILTGAASVSSYPGSSGGKVVTNVGRWGPGAKRSGTLSFPNVTVPATGVFTLGLYLVGNTDPAAQTIVISVSGVAADTLIVPAEPTCCVSRTVRVTLTSGSNTIVIGNPDGRAPSIDRIVISRP